MKTCGIIVEYNPFHKGHIYHIQKTKEITECDCLVAITSGHFSQRGLPSLISKYDKARLALEHGVNLVLELPVCFAAQSADRFAKFSINSLNSLDIDTICFGSETNDIEKLNAYADMLSDIDVDPSKSQLQNTFEILGDLSPNDILGVSYINACKEYGIKPVSIQRNGSFKSATATRNDYLKGQKEAFDAYFHKEQIWQSYYPYLRNILLLTSSKDLEKFHLVSEGIQNRLKESARKSDTWDDFLESAISKTYTAARIQRTCLIICMQITKDQMNAHPDYSSVKVLGFDRVGRTLLHAHKDADIISRFEDLDPFLQDIEIKTDVLYNSVMKHKIKEEKVIVYDR